MAMLQCARFLRDKRNEKMHIPDGLLDPKVSSGLMGIAAAVLGVCFAKVRLAYTEMVKSQAFAAVTNTGATFAAGGRRVLSKLGERKIQEMGMVASLVFAAQMFNFPIGSGTSGHLIGGVFAAVILGPFAGTLVIAAVLGVQMLLFADGGAAALGANIINMAVLGSLVGYYCYALLKKFLNERAAIALAAWFSVVLAAFACALEIGFSGLASYSQVIPAMLKSHALIGVGEILITLAMVDLFRRFFSRENTDN